MSMKELMRTLEDINKATGSLEKKPGTDKPVDRFTQLRREISDKLKAVREDIRTRNSMMEKGEDAKTAAKSHTIREQLKEIRSKQQSLEQEFFDLEKKNAASSTPIAVDEMRTRKQAVDLLATHVTQAEQLDSKGFTGGRDELFSQLLPVERLPQLPQDIEMSALPAEFLQQMHELDTQEEEINALLDRMAANVETLKDIALGMKDELAKQDPLIADLTSNTEKHTGRLQVLNRRLKEILKEENCGAQRVIIWIVMLVVLLALVIVIWKLVSTRTT